ncbi:hypothetical protein QYZ87_06430 [Porphyromonadaceae bacterium W3.11]|nr:hypothetical protein [Porphyromonadaceae bacterium W3.11]
MAVKKIRKISSTVLLIVALITVVVLGIYIFGGYVDPTAAKPEPVYTDLLMYTCYIVLGVTLLAMIVFAIVGFAGKLKTNPKGALGGLVAIVALAVLLGVTYAIGSTERLSVGADSAKYNTDFYLKFTDMWLYSIYVMLILCVAGLIWGAVRNAILKRN